MEVSTISSIPQNILQTSRVQIYLNQHAKIHLSFLLANPSNRKMVRARVVWLVGLSGSLDVVWKEIYHICEANEPSCLDIESTGHCGSVDKYSRASYVFNSIYQRNPTVENCNFGGISLLTDTDPSIGSCVFEASSGMPYLTALPPPAITYLTVSPPPPSITYLIVPLPPATSSIVSSSLPATTNSVRVLIISVASTSTVSVIVSLGEWRIYHRHRASNVNIECCNCCNCIEVWA